MHERISGPWIHRPPLKLYQAGQTLQAQLCNNAMVPVKVPDLQHLEAKTQWRVEHRRDKGVCQKQQFLQMDSANRRRVFSFKTILKE